MPVFPLCFPVFPHSSVSSMSPVCLSVLCVCVCGCVVPALPLTWILPTSTPVYNQLLMVYLPQFSFHSSPDGCSSHSSALVSLLVVLLVYLLPCLCPVLSDSCLLACLPTYLPANQLPLASSASHADLHSSSPPCCHPFPHFGLSPSTITLSINLLTFICLVPPAARIH